MDRIDPVRLEALLQRVPFATRVVAFDETTSTNDDAHRLAAEGALAGTVVIAERQSAGRGRLSRSWHSPDGLGVYVSVLLRPTEPIDLWTRFTLLAALAACRSCRAISGCDVAIKWPNDLLVGGRKLAGVLAELRSTGSTATALVLGVGINVGHAEEDFPPEVRAKATSLRMASGEKTFDRTILVASYVTELGSLADTLARGGWQEIAREWASRAPEAEGRRVRVTGSSPFEGTTRGVDATGALRVERATGEIVSLRSGESVVVLED